jgi:hypothetical protein
MGVLGDLFALVRQSARSPIDTSRNLFLHVSTKFLGKGGPHFYLFLVVMSPYEIFQNLAFLLLVENSIILVFNNLVVFRLQHL